MPPIVLQIISMISLAAKAVPELEKLYEQARALFSTLFAGGIITKEQQDSLMGWANAHEEAVLEGKVPVEFTVEANPE